jgi:hypothetical protein
MDAKKSKNSLVRFIPKKSFLREHIIEPAELMKYSKSLQP